MPSPTTEQTLSISMEDTVDEPSDELVSLQVMRRALMKIAQEDHPDGYFARIAKAALERAE